MKAQFERAPKPHDLKLLRNIVLKLSAPTLIVSAVLVILIALVWLYIFKQILAFGKGLDYSKLSFFGDEANKYIVEFSPYFWWLICLVGTYIVIRIVIAIVKAIMHHNRFKLVDQHSFELLSQQLSVPALDVLLWAWSDHDEPIRLGDLQQTKNELTGGKSIRLYRAAEQRQILEQAKLAQSSKDSDMASSGD